MANTTTYLQLFRETAIRVNALKGAQAASLETSYVASPLTTSEVASADFSFTAIQDSILMAEEYFATIIANCRHAWRACLRALTADVATGNPIPAFDSAGVPIIGAYGAVKDSSDSIALTEMPLDIVQRRILNTLVLVGNAYWFAMSGGIIYHTRTNVKIEVYSYKRSTFTQANPMLLPDALEPALVAQAVAFCTRDTVFESQAKYYGDYAALVAKSIQAGAEMPIFAPTRAAAELKGA